MNAEKDQVWGEWRDGHQTIEMLGPCTNGIYIAIYLEKSRRNRTKVGEYDQDQLLSDVLDRIVKLYQLENHDQAIELLFEESTHDIGILIPAKD